MLNFRSNSRDGKGNLFEKLGGAWLNSFVKSSGIFQTLMLRKQNSEKVVEFQVRILLKSKKRNLGSWWQGKFRKRPRQLGVRRVDLFGKLRFGLAGALTKRKAINNTVGIGNLKILQCRKPKKHCRKWKLENPTVLGSWKTL